MKKLTPNELINIIIGSASDSALFHAKKIVDQLKGRSEEERIKLVNELVDLIDDLFRPPKECPKKLKEILRCNA